jgi:signal transduction histidine kinase
MAMHNTDDIAVTVTTFFEELISLGLGDSTRCGIGILSPSEIMEVWTASIQNENKSTLHTGFLDMEAHPMLKGLQEHWSAGKALYEAILEGADKMDYFKAINEAPEYPVKMDLDTLPPTVYHYSFLFPQGTLFVFAESPLHEEIRDIFTRFSSVFGQTYTRYLDLERAEKQARESKIEAALERVRAKAMAMHSSEDLRQTITKIFEELKKLEVQSLRLGLGLVNRESPEGEIITSRIGDHGEIIEVSGTFRLEGHPILDSVYSHFKSQEDYFPVLQGDEIKSYYAAIQKEVDVQGMGTTKSHYGCFLYFPEGCLYAWAATPHSEEQVGILKKFSRVVEITYRRYKDLIEAEAREKEAVKQASLDRVRAEIASMRTAKDLERITPLVWKELTTLGIPFFRCGVFIMDEARQLVHVYLTTPAGKALGAMDLPFDFDMSLIQKGVDYWRRQKILVEEWDQAQFIEMTKKLMAQGQVKSAKSYQAGEKPPERLVLHQVPFAQGMLYVGNTEPLNALEMDIVKSLTRTFAVAYARYEDFKELEKAKKKVENTLEDLKATQAQLIQSEKMASLGELTAGIAHEIKNPLNFVNNFSEVSRELLQELMEEMENGDLEEVRALAGDVIQNLEKIVHHGQRADSIVKGMLQHSRSGDGKKEPTDLNELADEYLRLAYHGLRARDKAFNASMETDFDNTLGKVNVVPQDIGRVLLNLLTNAFHAVNERKAAAPEGYEPTVWVQTQKTDNGVEIAVRDNGGGIPEKIVDKIFQPFFTTKPTGQGTGLGLSLSYDIVKAHGGELNVESVEGEGTTFYINFKSTS